MIAATENRIHVGIGTYIGGGVTVFPVWHEAPEVKNYSWRPSSLRVGEVEQGARVDTLSVTNTSSRPHVIIEGDIFEGGWQTRTAATTMVLGRGETVEVPVLCVEQGRWGGDRTHANRRTRRTPYGVRKRMYDSRVEKRGSGQSEVWEEIHKLQSVHGFNNTGSLSDSLDDFKSLFDGGEFDTEFVDPGVANVRVAQVLPGQRGVIIGINGRIAACEIFGSTKGLTERFEAILDAARFEAGFAPPKMTQNYRARAFATEVTSRITLDAFVPEPVEVKSALGPLAFTSYCLGAGLVYAAILNQSELVG